MHTWVVITKLAAISFGMLVAVDVFFIAVNRSSESSTATTSKVKVEDQTAVASLTTLLQWTKLPSSCPVSTKIQTPPPSLLQAGPL